MRLMSGLTSSDWPSVRFGIERQRAMAIDFFCQPVRASGRFTQNYVENRVRAVC